MKLTDTSQLDWQAARDAAERITKLTNDAGFAPPEDVQRHGLLVARVAEQLNAIAIALCILPPPSLAALEAAP